MLAQLVPSATSTTSAAFIGSPPRSIIRRAAGGSTRRPFVLRVAIAGRRPHGPRSLHCLLKLKGAAAVGPRTALKSETIVERRSASVLPSSMLAKLFASLRVIFRRRKTSQLLVGRLSAPRFPTIKP